jgi:hypothetical protein
LSQPQARLLSISQEQGIQNNLYANKFPQQVKEWKEKNEYDNSAG